MVKKLIKHEFAYYIRFYILMLPILLSIGLFTRFLRIFKSDHVSYIIVFVSSMGMLYFASFACIILTFILVIIRYYKNMFSSEGYLTLTLPVTYHQHLFVKILVSMCCYIVTFITICITWLIVGTGFPNVLNEIKDMFTLLFSEINSVHLVFYIIEILILLLISLVYSILLSYTCITIGQTAKKNRILLAVGAYFGYHMITQVLSTIIMVALTVLGLANALNFIGRFIVNYPYLAVHIGFFIAIIIYVGIGVLFYYLIMKILNNKLNLE